jgi:hypothetical protein
MKNTKGMKKRKNKYFFPLLHLVGNFKVNDEIYAKYFENSRSVAFYQRRMEEEIEKFTERLDKQFEEWGKKEQSKKGKN